MSWEWVRSGIELPHAEIRVPTPEAVAPEASVYTGGQRLTKVVEVHEKVVEVHEKEVG
jgi:hypothetical protein